jgi:hypothetical protein
MPEMHIHDWIWREKEATVPGAKMAELYQRRLLFTAIKRERQARVLVSRARKPPNSPSGLSGMCRLRANQLL